MAIGSSFGYDCKVQGRNPMYVPQATMDGRCSAEYGCTVVDRVEGSFRKRAGRVILALVDTLVGG